MIYPPKQLDLFIDDKEDALDQIEKLVVELRLENRLQIFPSDLEMRIKRSLLRDDLIEKLSALKF